MAWILAVEVRQGTLAWMVVVEVRQGTLGGEGRGEDGEEEKEEEEATNIKSIVTTLTWQVGNKRRPENQKLRFSPKMTKLVNAGELITSYH